MSLLRYFKASSDTTSFLIHVALCLRQCHRRPKRVLITTDHSLDHMRLASHFPFYQPIVHKFFSRFDPAHAWGKRRSQPGIVGAYCENWTPRKFPAIRYYVWMWSVRLICASYALHRYSCMSPTLNGSSIIWFLHGTVTYVVLNWMRRLLLPLELFNITVLPASNCSQLVGVIFHWLNSPSWYFTNLLCLSLPNTYWWQQPWPCWHLCQRVASSPTHKTEAAFVANNGWMNAGWMLGGTPTSAWLLCVTD